MAQITNNTRNTFSQINHMIGFTANSKVSLWKDETGKFYVRYPVMGNDKLTELDSDDFADWLWNKQNHLPANCGGTTTHPLSYFRHRVKELVASAKFDDKIPETKLLPRVVLQ